jgi:hypothetical protein
MDDQEDRRDDSALAWWEQIGKHQIGEWENGNKRTNKTGRAGATSRTVPAESDQPSAEAN